MLDIQRYNAGLHLRSCNVKICGLLCINLTWFVSWGIQVTIIFGSTVKRCVFCYFTDLITSKVGVVFLL